MTFRHPDFPHLEPVPPILEGAVCIGIDSRGRSLMFLSPKYGEVQIAVSAQGGGKLLFQYKVWDDTSEMVYTCRGTHGDPMLDAMIDGPLTWNEEDIR